MELHRCWPYEELKVEKLEDPRAFRFETPWYSSIVTVSEDGAKLFERLFSEDPSRKSPELLLNEYSLALSPLIHEPFAYILPQVSSNPGLHGELAGMKPPAFNATWDVETALTLAKVPGTETFSPLSLFSVMRRFFFLDAMEADGTRELYTYLGDLSPARSQNSLAFIVSQNLHVTRKAHEVLSAALPRAGSGEEALMDFIKAETGHDRIMQAALEAFDQSEMETWATEVHPATRGLMETFRHVAQNHFLAFALAVNLFERPHAEKVHPLTTLLRKFGYGLAAARYEQHHEINEAGDHDQIGLDLVRGMQPVSRAYAEDALRWGELMTRAVTAHSASLLKALKEKSFRK